MIISEAEKLRSFEGTHISIGITADGSPVKAISVPWERTGSAYNMRIPNVFLEEKDLSTPEIMAALDKFTVIGCYILTALEDYSFLSKFVHLEDVYIRAGENITDLSFMENLTEWFMFYLEDAHLTNLDALLIQKERKSTFHSFCLGLNRCQVDDVSAIERSGIHLSELIVWGPKSHEKKWHLPAMTRRYYVCE